MNREQQEVLSLLKEVDIICRKHQITYFLSPWLTLCAVLGRPFPQNPLAGKVIVKIEDMERLRKIMEEEPTEGRALECMRNNKRFPGLFLRYVNKDTLCYRMDEGRNYRYPGIGIDIIPLRKKNRSKKVRKWDQRLETGWVQTCDLARRDRDFYKTVCGFGVRVMGLMGREALGRKIYDRLCANQTDENAKKYMLRWIRDEVYEYPAKVFQETKEIDLEGEKFLVPCDEETYLGTFFGKNYKTRTYSTKFNQRNMVFSALIGCEEFLKEPGIEKRLYKARKKQYQIDQHARHYKEYYEECWDYAKACGSRQELRVAYREKRDYIQELWESRDLVRLDAVFRPCRRMMDRCLETGEVFELDEDLMEIYLAYLKANGNTKLLEKIRQNRKSKPPQQAPGHQTCSVAELRGI